MSAGQQVQRAHRVHVPALGDETADRVLDDPQQRLELGGRPGEIVGGQQPQGDDLDAGFPAPLEQLEDLVGALLVAAGHVEQAGGPGPPAVAVTHHADMPRDRPRGQGTFEPARVEPVNQATKSHVATFLSPLLSHKKPYPTILRYRQRAGERDGRTAAAGRFRPCGSRCGPGQAIDLRIRGASPANDERYWLRSRFILSTMAALVSGAAGAFDAAAAGTIAEEQGIVTLLESGLMSPPRRARCSARRVSWPVRCAGLPNVPPRPGAVLTAGRPARNPRAARPGARTRPARRSCCARHRPPRGCRGPGAPAGAAGS